MRWVYNISLARLHVINKNLSRGVIKKKRKLWFQVVLTYAPHTEVQILYIDNLFRKHLLRNPVISRKFGQILTVFNYGNLSHIKILSPVIIVSRCKRQILLNVLLATSYRATTNSIGVRLLVSARYLHVEIHTPKIRHLNKHLTKLDYIHNKNQMKGDIETLFQSEVFKKIQTGEFH